MTAWYWVKEGEQRGDIQQITRAVPPNQGQNCALSYVCAAALTTRLSAAREFLFTGFKKVRLHQGSVLL